MKSTKITHLFLGFFLTTTAAFSQTWNQVWADEFNGSSLGGHWVIETGTGPYNDGWGNNELQYYRAENVAVGGGSLQITARKESFGGKEYTSARIKTQGHKSFQYGKLEARIAMPNFQGVWPAFWMLGNSIATTAWPSCGEIDIMEHINTGDKIFGTVHWSDANGNYVNYSGEIFANSSINNYHLYTVEWNASDIKWFLDGVQYHSFNIANGINGTSEFHQNYFFLINMAIGGTWPGFSVDNTAFPKTMFVDYVKVSKLENNVATVYRDCSYAGKATGLPIGDYTLSQMIDRGMFNEDISSLRVSNGYEVVLYEHDGFSGAAIAFSGDDDCLVDNSWNDRTSSMRVRAKSTSTTSIKIEAENYIAMSGVQTESCSEGTLNVGWIDAGDWMAYNVNISTAGTYRVTYRVASPNSNTTLRLEKDNGATLLGTVTIPNTGGWQNWGNVFHDVYLPAGSYGIGIATSTGGFNINYFTIGSTNARLAAPEIVSVSSSNVQVYPNPVSRELHIGNSDSFSSSDFRIINAQGKEILKGVSSSNGIDVSQLNQGIYTIIFNVNGKKVTKQFVKK